MNSFVRNLEKQLQKPEPRAARGRPARPDHEAWRVILWAHAVRTAAGVPKFSDLELVLGEDGKWLGVWARYRKGLSSPSAERIARIEETFPLTAQFYTSDFWTLLRNKNPTWSELAAIAYRLPDRFKSYPVFADHEGDYYWGRFMNMDIQRELIPLVEESISEDFQVMEALTAVMLALREAELTRDARQYLAAHKALACIEWIRYENPYLVGLHPWLIPELVHDLWFAHFQPIEVDLVWKRQMERFETENLPRLTRSRVLNCLLQLEI